MRDGLGPARLRLRGGSVLEELRSRFGPAAAAKVTAGEVVDADGVALDAGSVMPAGSHVYFYRELADEVPVPFDIPVLHRDDDIVVVDKPHFLATMPRGRHVAQTALVRLRRELDLPGLSPAHRLDRLTAGVLVFTTRREVRGRYQTLFSRGLVHKTYLARSSGTSVLALPRVVRSRIVKRRGLFTGGWIEPGEPNAATLVEAVGGGLYRLTPRTGRTHQLRVHMASLGLPIDGDPLYPSIIDVAAVDFSVPLRLLACSFEFDDPVTGSSAAVRQPALSLEAARPGWHSLLLALVGVVPVITEPALTAPGRSLQGGGSRCRGACCRHGALARCGTHCRRGSGISRYTTAEKGKNRHCDEAHYTDRYRQSWRAAPWTRSIGLLHCCRPLRLSSHRGSP